MITIPIKPLSVNSAWQGKRFKTNVYKKYERDVLLMLPMMTMPEAPYEIYFKFGFSSVASDLDNPVKLILDILTKKYKFNDKLIFRAIIERCKVDKGQEFIQFNIQTFKP